MNRPATRYTVSVSPRGGSLPRIGLSTATLGDDGGVLPLLADQLDGLVVAGFGVGHVPESWAGPLEAIANRIPVVLSSRTGAGFTAADTYGFAGSERDLLRRGLIPAGILDPYKARLLLQVLLHNGTGRAGLHAAFQAASAPAEPP